MKYIFLLVILICSQSQNSYAQEIGGEQALRVIAVKLGVSSAQSSTLRGYVPNTSNPCLIKLVVTSNMRYLEIQQNHSNIKNRVNFGFGSGIKIVSNGVNKIRMERSYFPDPERYDHDFDWLLIDSSSSISRKIIVSIYNDRESEGNKAIMSCGVMR